MKRKVLTAADILGANDVETKTVECPEWGGDVLIKSMSGTERDAFESSMRTVEEGKGAKDKAKAKANMDNIRARLVAFTAVGEDGERLFTDDQVADLGKKSAKALDRCFDVARELNGMFDGDVDEAKKD